MCILPASSDLYSPPAEILHHLWLRSHLSLRCTWAGKIIAWQMKLCSRAKVWDPPPPLTNSPYLSTISLSIFNPHPPHPHPLQTGGSVALPAHFHLQDSRSSNVKKKSITGRQGEVTHAIAENYLTDRLIHFPSGSKTPCAVSTENDLTIDEITDVTLDNQVQNCLFLRKLIGWWRRKYLQVIQPWRKK